MHNTLLARPSRFELLGLAVLALLAGWLMLRDLGDASFHDGDEALYASVAREMAASGDLLTPTYWGDPLLNKPPLLYWLMTVSGEFAPGNFEAQMRLPSALFGLGLLVLVYGMARRLGGAWCGAGAALLMLANHQWLFEHCARSANLDSGLVTLMFAAIVFGSRAHACRRYLWLSGVCTALVMMVKLPLAVFLVPVLFLHLVSFDRPAAWRWLKAAVLCGCVIVLPWHLWAFIEHGTKFWEVYFLYEIFARTGDAVLDTDATWWTHFLAFWQSWMPFGPWLFLAAACALLCWPRTASSDETRSLRLLAGYAIFVMVFFSFIKSKWPWYGLPAYPALAVLGSVQLVRLHRSSWRPAVPAILALLAFLRLVAVQVNTGYTPAARQSRLWPLHSQLLEFDSGGAAPAAWALAIGALLLACALYWRPLRSRAGAVSLVLAGLALAPALWTVSQVPTGWTSPAANLARTLTTGGINSLRTLGFWPADIYDNRQTPLTSVYFLSVPVDNITDCGSKLAQLLEGDQTSIRSALVIHATSFRPRVRKTLSAQLRARNSNAQVWILDPSHTGSFRRFDWRQP